MDFIMGFFGLIFAISVLIGAAVSLAIIFFLYREIGKNYFGRSPESDLHTYYEDFIRELPPSEEPIETKAA